MSRESVFLQFDVDTRLVIPSELFRGNLSLQPGFSMAAYRLRNPNLMPGFLRVVFEIIRPDGSSHDYHLDVSGEESSLVKAHVDSTLITDWPDKRLHRLAARTKLARFKESIKELHFNKVGSSLILNVRLKGGQTWTNDFLYHQFSRVFTIEEEAESTLQEMGER